MHRCKRTIPIPIFVLSYRAIRHAGSDAGNCPFNGRTPAFPMNSSFVIWVIHMQPRFMFQHNEFPLLKRIFYPKGEKWLLGLLSPSNYLTVSI